MRRALPVEEAVAETSLHETAARELGYGNCSLKVQRA